jgi:Glycosyl transferase family 2
MNTLDVAPLLSIVVPTKNRKEYAISLLKGISAFDDANLEVIVQDNSETASLKDFVAILGDKRIRYRYNAKPLSMHENFELGIDDARGEFVCAIGDDDGIMVRAALASLREAKAEGADAVLTEMYSYSWPGTRHKIWGEMGGPVFIQRVFPAEQKHVVNAKAEVEKLFKNGSIGGLGFLPRVYQGYVSKNSLDALKQHSGTYFPGGSPDLANAVGIVPFVQKVLFDPSVTLITGHSPRSGGGQGSAGRHHAELEKTSHLPAATIRDWDPGIPRFWSGTTIYAQTAVEAAKAVGLTPVTAFNYARVCVACFIFQPSLYRAHVRRALKVSGWTTYALLPFAVKEIAVLNLRRLGTFVRNINFYYFGGRKLGEFENIEEIMVGLHGGQSGWQKENN